MEIFHSDWLIKMLEKSSAKPEERILNLFDILSDWIEAPQIHASLKQTANSTPPFLLLNYLSQQAKEAGAQAPEMLAEQLIFLASSAIKSRIEDVHSESLHHAKQAAKALLSAQLLSAKPQAQAFSLKMNINFRALVLFVGLIIIGGLFYQHSQSEPAQSHEASALLEPSNTKATDDMAANPKQTAEMYASLETMRGGDCQYIEALQIPDADKKIYLENVVGGQVPTNVHDQLIAQHYLQKIRCNYSPMLMKNSTH